MVDAKTFDASIDDQAKTRRILKRSKEILKISWQVELLGPMYYLLCGQLG